VNETLITLKTSEMEIFLFCHTSRIFKRCNNGKIVLLMDFECFFCLCVSFSILAGTTENTCDQEKKHETINVRFDIDE
jgi:hypothetical protein